MAYDKLVLQVCDKEYVGKPTILGSIILSLKQIVTSYSTGDLKRGFAWKRVYGAPLKVNNKVAAHEMSVNPDTAMCWHGRVLFHFHVEDSKFPRVGVDDFPKETLELYKGSETRYRYELQAEVGVGWSLPFNKKQKFRVKIQIADHEIITPEPNIVKTGYNRWAYRFGLSFFLAPFAKIEEVADVFIYLID